MGDQFFANLINFLAANLDNILIGIGVLVFIFLLTLAFPRKRKKKLASGSVEQVRKQFDDAAASLEALIASYKEQLATYDAAIDAKKNELQALDQQGILLQEHVAKYNDAPVDLKNAALQQSLAQMGYKKRSGAKFFWGMLLGLLLAALGWGAYQYQAEIMALFAQ